MPRGLVVLQAWLVVFGLVGCSSRESAPVEGIVTLDGQPLPRVTVMLVPEGNEARPAQAQTNQEGVFQLAETDGRALPPGRYKVVVVASQAPNSRRIPTVYAEPSRTPLAIDVPPSGPVELLLRSK
jgi:hypothetical protein